MGLIFLTRLVMHDLNLFHSRQRDTGQVVDLGFECLCDGVRVREEHMTRGPDG
jgi:hypothetical protein